MFMETPSKSPDVELYDWLTEKQILLAYNGEVDGELVDLLVQLAEKALKKASAKVKVRKKIVNILIESLQNSYHYTHTLPTDIIQNNTNAIKSPFLILCKETPTLQTTTEENLEEGIYWIITGNWIQETDADTLKARIQLFETMSEDALQEYYINSLNKDEVLTEGGAGLGLIDIMRRSNRQATFEFKETEQPFSVFVLKIKVN